MPVPVNLRKTFTACRRASLAPLLSMTTRTGTPLAAMTPRRKRRAAAWPRRTDRMKSSLTSPRTGKAKLCDTTRLGAHNAKNALAPQPAEIILEKRHQSVSWPALDFQFDALKLQGAGYRGALRGSVGDRGQGCLEVAGVTADLQDDRTRTGTGPEDACLGMLPSTLILQPLGQLGRGDAVTGLEAL